MESSSREHYRQMSGLGDRFSLRIYACRFLEGSANQVRHKMNGDEVQHDRADYLEHVKPSLELCRDSSPECSGHHSRQGAEKRRKTAQRISKRKADSGRSGCTCKQLSLRADVEYAASECESYRKPREDQRSASNKCIGQERQLSHVRRSLGLEKKATDHLAVRRAYHHPRPPHDNHATGKLCELVEITRIKGHCSSS